MRSETRAAGRVAVPTFVLVLACFFLSGFAALLYQTVWTRQFAFVFGTADLAVAAVLAGYMAGLAAGAAAATRFAGVARRPILVYGLLELAIAAAALLVPVAIAGSSALAGRLFGNSATGIAAAGIGLATFRLALAFAILLVPTACMGATLPLLARMAVTGEGDLGSKVGWLYACNTAGAVCGTVVAAFALFPRLGLAATAMVGVAVNGIVCVLAVLADRSAVTPAAAPAFAASTNAGPTSILLVALISGMASFTYEVVWTRLLGHVLGGSLYAFATMLATFLAGIALGAALAARCATSAARAFRGLAIAEIAVAAGTLGAFRAMDALPALALRVGAGKDPTASGNVVVTALVMLPATLAIGATFPFAVRAFARRSDQAAVASARVYAWNTVGAIVGALGTGYVAMPVLGYAGVITVASAANLLSAFVVALAAPRRAPLLAAAALGGIIALGLAPPTTPWKLVATSPLAIGRPTRPPEFFAVGRSAGVAVGRESGVLKLRTNGLPEGLMLPPHRYRRGLPDRWLGALPFLARPDARRVLVVGLGAGTALEAMPRTLAEVDVVEIESRVVEANERFRGERAIDPLALPGLRIVIDDARGALSLTSKRYDAIVSQPSHPWTAGASHLYTREFFSAVRDHLTADGVFVQWIDLDLVDQPLLGSLLATLLDAFSHVRVYRPFFRGTALFLASNAPLDVEATASRALAAAPRELARAGLQTPEDAAAAFALDTEGARALANNRPLTTDDRNLLEMRAIRVETPLGYRGADELFAPLDPLPARVHHLDRLLLVRRLLADWDFPRAGRVLQALVNPVERLTATGLVALATEREEEGRANLRAALAADPNAYEARIALLRAERSRRDVVGPPLADPARAVLDGWRHEDEGDWAAVRALDDRLAAVRPSDPVYGDALRLRAAWRIETGGIDRGTEALTLLDLVLPMSVDPEDYVRRARAALVADDPATALENLAQAFDAATPGALPRVAARVEPVLATVPATPDGDDVRVAIEKRLAAFRR